MKCEVRETAVDALPLGRTAKVGSGSLLYHSTSRDKPVSPQLWAYRPNLWVSSDPLKRERVRSHLREMLNLSQQERGAVDCLLQLQEMGVPELVTETPLQW